MYARALPRQKEQANGMDNMRSSQMAFLPAFTPLLRIISFDFRSGKDAFWESNSVAWDRAASHHNLSQHTRA